MSAPEPVLTRSAQHLHLLDNALERLSQAGKEDSPEHGDLFQRRDRIVALAMGCPASNLRDVAALVLMISDVASMLEVYEMPTDKAQALGARITLAASSILEVLQTIGIRTDDLGPGDAQYEIQRLLEDHILPVDLVREVAA